MNLLCLVYIALHLKHCRSSKRDSYLQNTILNDLQLADSDKEILSRKLSISEVIEEKLPNTQISNSLVLSSSNEQSSNFRNEGPEIIREEYKRIRQKRSVESAKTQKSTRRNSDEVFQRRQLFLPNPFVEETHFQLRGVDIEGLQLGKKSISPRLFHPAMEKTSFHKPWSKWSTDNKYLSTGDKFVTSNVKDSVTRRSLEMSSPFGVYGPGYSEKQYDSLTSQERQSPASYHHQIAFLTPTEKHQHYLSQKYVNHPLAVRTEEEHTQPEQQLGHNNNYQILKNHTAKVNTVNNGTHHALTAINKADIQFKGDKKDSKIIPFRNHADNIIQKVDTSDKLNALLRLHNQVTADFKENKFRNETVISSSSNVVQETKTQTKLRDNPIVDDDSKMSPPQDWSLKTNGVRKQTIQTRDQEFATKRPFLTHSNLLRRYVTSEKQESLAESPFYWSYNHYNAPVYELIQPSYHQNEIPASYSIVPYISQYPQEGFFNNQETPQNIPYSINQDYQPWPNPYNLKNQHQLQEVGNLQTSNQYFGMNNPFNHYQRPHNHEYANLPPENVNLKYPDDEIHGRPQSQNQHSNVEFYPQSHLSTFHLPQSASTPSVIIRVSSGPLIQNQPFGGLSTVTKVKPFNKPRNPQSTNNPIKETVTKVQPTSFSDPDVKKPITSQNHSPKKPLSPAILEGLKNPNVQNTTVKGPLKTPYVQNTSLKGPLEKTQDQDTPLKGPVKKTQGQNTPLKGTVKKPNLQNTPLKEPVKKPVQNPPPKRPFKKRFKPKVVPAYGGIYFDPISDLPVPLKSKWSDSKMAMSRYASLPCTCDRDNYQCGCCVKYGINFLGFHRVGE